ncbi:hypothetical protein A2W24_01980 [Microgenomates group bacterium RBG_16_45_19]|nr:MAG: hypothetical protein A2W24_01980 [Microgenomates group bacterium RBG_16_45_19]
MNLPENWCCWCFGGLHQDTFIDLMLRLRYDRSVKILHYLLASGSLGPIYHKTMALFLHPSNRRLSLFGGLFVFIAILGLYSLTMPRSLTGYQDSDLFLLLSQRPALGLPPGYPLYLSLLTLFTHLPWLLTLASRGHLLSVLFSALTLSLFFLTAFWLIQTLAKRLPRRYLPLTILAAFWSTAFLGLSLYFWLYGQLADKYALTNLILIVVLLALWQLLAHQGRPLVNVWLYLFALAFGLGLNHWYGFLTLVPAVAYLITQIFNRQAIKTWLIAFGLFLLAWLLPLSATLLLPQADLAWPKPQSLTQWLNYWGRSEFFNNQFLSPQQPWSLKALNLTQATEALNFYFQALNHHFGYLWLPVSLLAFYLGFKFYRSWFVTLFLIFLGLGPFVVIYLYQDESWLNQAALIPQLIPGFIVFALILILAWWQLGYRFTLAASHLLKPKFVWLTLISLTLGATLLLLYFRFPQVDLYAFNFPKQRYQTILNQVPPQSLLVCFAKSACYSLLYLHTVEAIRPDVSILPITSFMIQSQLMANPLSPFMYPDSPMAIADIISQNLGQRPVIAVELNDYYYNLLGLNVPFMFYLPSGSWGQLTRQLPAVIPTYPLSFSDQAWSLAPMRHDPHRLQQLTLPARDHLFNASQLFKMGHRSRAVVELNRAANLFFQLTAKEQRQLESVRQNLEQTPAQADYQPGVSVRPASDWLRFIPQYLTENKISRAYQAAYGAVLVDPKNSQARLALAQVLETMERLPEAILEYQHALQLDPTNASASAALNRLTSYTL